MVRLHVYNDIILQAISKTRQGLKHVTYQHPAQIEVNCARDRRYFLCSIQSVVTLNFKFYAGTRKINGRAEVRFWIFSNNFLFNN